MAIFPAETHILPIGKCSRFQLESFQLYLSSALCHNRAADSTVTTVTEIMAAVDNSNNGRKGGAFHHHHLCEKLALAK